MAQELDLEALLHEMTVLVGKTQPAPTATAPAAFTGFQSPIKGSYYNSGNYSPGAATDARHAGGHKGVDLRAAGGTSIYPIAPGIVTYVGTDNKGGNVVNISHPQEVRSYYAHMGTVTVHKGDKVGLDTVIGTVGASGNAKGTWPHLHIQVWKSNQLQNPAAFFSVPAYTAPDTRKERVWSSDTAKMQAQNFNMNTYRENQRVASKIDGILVLSSLFEDLSK